MIRRSRTAALLAALAATVSALGLILLGSGTASAHGVAMFPGSRTYLCYKDAITGSGAVDPTNPACAAAIAQSGSSSLYNWFAVLDSNAGGKGQGYVPDGTICSAGNKSPYDFSGYNLARDDWPKTHLTSGSTIQLQYSNWAAHPGDFRVYFTKQGWSPTTPLAWSDLQLASTVTNPPASGSPGTDGGHYYWNQALPSGRSGNALMFVQWVRSDSNENFFSCSDIVFDGGNGEVTGIRGSGGTTPPPDGGGGTTPPPTGGTGSCMATYTVDSSWSGGFQATVTVMNHGTAPINGWHVGWTPGSGTTIGSVWSGTLSTASGGGVTVANAAYNGTIPADGSTTFGFTATSSSGNNLPSGSLNCTTP
ncbi:chitin-binding protein [Streptomyces sp. S816]|uniref:lytic polysaccharide monooxygenase auxiliary activity family 9 protein n=1 Tax=Streptomyces sp. S816 TaxID=2283197 RepID=UPI00109CD35E|nr:lytic polysaccharide monooxygenase [Streptomyces sp. S816]TGZ16398.1 chitin-binding protein [Streptomyces sp. S816]